MKNQNQRLGFISTALVSATALFVLFQAGGLSLPRAQAEETSVVKNNTSSSSENKEAGNIDESITVASVEIYDAKILSQNKNNFKISFGIFNGKKVQPGIKYAVNLIQKSEKGQNIVDEKVYPEILDLKENQTMGKEINYTAPSYLKGDYELWLIAKNQNGLILALSNSGEVKLEGDNQFMEILPDSCYLTVKGEEDNPKYSLRQGTDVEAQEELMINCEVVNHFDSEATLIPNFETYYRSTFGDLVSRNQSDEKIVIGPGEKKPLSLIIPKVQTPQAYDVILFFTGAKKESVSNSVSAHYVLRGTSATIQNLILDKDYYKKGDKAALSLFWSPSADAFSGSRLDEGTPLEKVNLEIAIKDHQNTNCSYPVSKEIEKNSLAINLDIPIISDCQNPKVTVVIKDAQENILDDKSFEIMSEDFGKEQPISQFSGKSKSHVLVGVIIGVLIIMGLIILIMLVRRKGKDKSLLIFLFLIFGSSIFGNTLLLPGEAEAATRCLNKVCYDYSRHGRTYTVCTHLCSTANINKSVYNPGETIRAAGSIYDTNCGNVLYNNTNIDWKILGYDGYAPIANNKSAPTTPGSYTAYFKAHVVMYNFGSWGTIDKYIYISIPFRVIGSAPSPPSCNARFHPSSITAPGSSTISWRSSNATSARYSCTGPISGSGSWGSIGTSGSAPFNFNRSQTGRERCTITVKNSANRTSTCSASVRVNSPAPSDTTPPSLNISGNCPTGGGNFTFSANASDASGIQKIYLYVNGSYKKACYSSRCSYTVNGRSSQTYALKAYAYDNSSNHNRTSRSRNTTCSAPPAPTLSATLNANPSSGNAPLNGVDLTARASGTASGTINYTFYCNRSDAGTNITSGYAHKKDGTNQNPYTANNICSYASPGTYTAKVIIERGGLAAERRTTVTVNAVAVDGVCGNSDGGSFFSAPSSNLCSAGTPSAVIGSGPWTWTCIGLGGGTTASCSAQKSAGAKNWKEVAP